MGVCKDGALGLVLDLCHHTLSVDSHEMRRVLAGEHAEFQSHSALPVRFNGSGVSQGTSPGQPRPMASCALTRCPSTKAIMITPGCAHYCAHQKWSMFENWAVAGSPRKQSQQAAIQCTTIDGCPNLLIWALQVSVDRTSHICVCAADQLTVHHLIICPQGYLCKMISHVNLIQWLRALSATSYPFSYVPESGFSSSSLTILFAWVLPGI